MPTPEELARKYMTPRAIELDRLQRYVEGTQYDGRPAWFDVSSPVPLFERKPCTIYQITESAIGSHTSFVLGEDRWPRLTSATSEDDRELDPEWGLSEKDSDVLDRFVNVVLVKYAALQTVATEMLGDAMGMRSVGVVISVQKGKLCAETVRAAWCTPTLESDGTCTKLEISYPYIEDWYDDEENRWKKRCMLYRRVIDETSDTVFKPTKALDDGRQPSWQVDKTRIQDHGLGFCPVIWYPFMKPCSTVNVIDGVAIHERQLDEIDGLNYALSQKQRTAVTTGDPQLIEAGVPDDHNPAPLGETSRGSIETRPGPDGKPISVFGSKSAPRRGIARKRGAGVIWRYPDANVKVTYLTIPAEAIQAIAEHAKGDRAMIAEGLHVVFIDPAELKMHSALSGKALNFMFKHQLAFDDKIRTDFAENALKPLVNMLLRVVLVIGRKNPRGLYIPGVKKVLAVLEGFERDRVDEEGNAVDGATKVWLPPRLEPMWGPYFAPTETDQQAVATLVALLLKAQVITRQVAIEKLVDSGVLDVGSSSELVDAIMEEIARNAAIHQGAMHDAMQALNDGENTTPVGDGGDDGGGGSEPTPGRKKPARKAKKSKASAEGAPTGNQQAA